MKNIKIESVKASFKMSYEVMFAVRVYSNLAADFAACRHSRTEGCIASIASIGTTPLLTFRAWLEKRMAYLAVHHKNDFIILQESNIFSQEYGISTEHRRCVSCMSLTYMSHKSET